MTLLTHGDGSASYQPSDEDTACSGRIPPRAARGFRLRRGDVLRVTDPHGGQVAGLVACREGEPASGLSAGRTIDYEGKLWLSTGDVLWSSDSRQLFTILRDDVGRHDVLLAPRGHAVPAADAQVDRCMESLRLALEPFGVPADAAAATFNIFMHVDVGTDGGIVVRPPLSGAGDAIELRAEADLVCALVACSAAGIDEASASPIDFQVLPAVGG